MSSVGSHSPLKSGFAFRPLWIGGEHAHISANGRFTLYELVSHKSILAFPLPKPKTQIKRASHKSTRSPHTVTHTHTHTLRRHDVASTDIFLFDVGFNRELLGLKNPQVFLTRQRLSERICEVDVCVAVAEILHVVANHMKPKIHMLRTLRRHARLTQRKRTLVVVEDQREVCVVAL